MNWNRKGNSMAFFLITLILFHLIAYPAFASDDNWPKKPITIFIGFSAGGTADVINRGLAREMQDYLKTEITCLNVTGASASVAGKQTMSAAADGYTWFGGNAHNAAGWKTLGYANVTWTNFYGFHAVTSPYVLFVSANSQWKKTEDLVAEIKQKPKKIKWGSAGLGSINHVTGEYMLDLLGAQANHVPYKGGREAAIKLMGGDIDFSWAGISDIFDLAKAGKIRLLGIAKQEGMKLETTDGAYVIPSLFEKWPKLRETENLLYWGFHVRRETPDTIVEKIGKAFEYAVKQKRFIELCVSRYCEIVPFMGPEDDKLNARLESIYAWGLYNAGLAAKGVSPANFNIPKIQDLRYPPNEEAKNMKKWPSSFK